VTVRQNSCRSPAPRATVAPWSPCWFWRLSVQLPSSHGAAWP